MTLRISWYESCVSEMFFPLEMFDFYKVLLFLAESFASKRLLQRRDDEPTSKANQQDSFSFVACLYFGIQ